ncbi:MAG: hypothetical protein QF453_04770, partial [Candidatus Marinimicrobia bacterium]|nr:hypothetical protein [Candidatus Neomarinimicrobiota bacterium]
ISSPGKTIQHGGTYPMTATVIHNAGRVIINMALTNGLISGGTSTNSDRKNSTNCEGGIKQSENLKTMTWKNC